MDAVFEEVRRKFPGIGRATVYRNLLQLAEEGKIRSVSLPTSPMRYDGRTSPHYHLRCSQCGSFLDIDADLEPFLQARINVPTGAVIETHDVIFGGLCPLCSGGFSNEPGAASGESAL